MYGNRKLIMAAALCATLTVLAQAPSPAGTYYVATTGSDVIGDGSQANPWGTIGYADANSRLVAAIRPTARATTRLSRMAWSL